MYLFYELEWLVTCIFCWTKKKLSIFLSFCLFLRPCFSFLSFCCPSLSSLIYVFVFLSFYVYLFVWLFALSRSKHFTLKCVKIHSLALSGHCYEKNWTHNHTWLTRWGHSTHTIYCMYFGSIQHLHIHMKNQ